MFVFGLFRFRIDWSKLDVPLSSSLFEKFLHQSVVVPCSALGFSESIWSEEKEFASKLHEKGFSRPISILYNSFKRFYPECPSFRCFLRWFSLMEKEENCSKNDSISTNFQCFTDLFRQVETIEPEKLRSFSVENLDEIWFFVSISIRFGANSSGFNNDVLLLDDAFTRLNPRAKKFSSNRYHLLFALTPSGRFSNQLLIHKPNRMLKNNFQSTPFTRIISNSSNTEVLPEHLELWIEDFLSFPFAKSKWFVASFLETLDLFTFLINQSRT